MVEVREDIEGGQIEVERLAKRPESIKTVPGNGKIYQYLRIEKEEISDELIENVSIRFKVKKEWIVFNRSSTIKEYWIKYIG